MLEISNYKIKLHMLIIFVTKVGQENGECMQYNKSVTMHSFPGEIYLDSKLGKKMIVRSGQNKVPVAQR